MVSDDEEQSEITFLKTLSKKEKKKLLMYVSSCVCAYLTCTYLS